jgi:hypothetical protein
MLAPFRVEPAAVQSLGPALVALVDGNLDAGLGQALRQAQAPMPPPASALHRMAAEGVIEVVRTEHQGSAGPHMTGVEALGFSHTLLRLEAELAWHEECLKALPRDLRREQRAR